MPAFVADLAEIVLLRRAEERARAVGEAERDLAREHVTAATLRLRASRSIGNPIPAIELLRVARTHALRAASATGGTAVVEEDGPRAADDDLAVDRADYAENERTRERLEHEVAALLASTEVRSPAAVRAVRYGRAGAMALFVLLLALPWLRAHVGLQNVALGRPVTVSSLRLNPPSGAELVDGHSHGTLGVHTNDELAPQIVIDLQEARTIQTIRVHNRTDGWYDDCLPLLVDVSENGTDFEPLARRTEHFSVWSIDAAGRHVRAVRIRRDQPGYIALNRVEVLGR